MNRNFVKLSTLAVCIAALGLVYCGTEEENNDTKTDAGTVVIPKVDAGTTTTTDGGGTVTGEENTNAACSDGVDNDGDNHLDCDDYDCSRNASVTVCGAGTDAGTPVEQETGDTQCQDGTDNDGDNFIDCKDFSCCKNGVPAEGVTVCAAITCEGPGNLNVEYGDTECSNGTDDDADNFIDCKDNSCCKNGVPAQGVTVCAANSCEGPGNENVEYGDAECANGTDEDGDGFTDCLDRSCCWNGVPATGVTVCGDDGTGKCKQL